MKIDWKGLLQGMYNSVAGKDWIKQLAAYRYDTFCQSCEFNSSVAKAAGTYSSVRFDEHCTRCGCNLEWKTHQLSSSCPIGRWPAEVTQQEAEQIAQKIAAEKTTP